MLSFDTIAFALMWNVVHVLFKFANTYMDATCSNPEVQMHWNKS